MVHKWDTKGRESIREGRGGEDQEVENSSRKNLELVVCRGRITSFYDPEALLFLGRRRRRDLTLTSQHSPVFVFTAASTPRLQPPLLWIHAVCRAWGWHTECVSVLWYSGSVLTPLKTTVSRRSLYVFMRHISFSKQVRDTVSEA